MGRLVRQWKKVPHRKARDGFVLMATAVALALTSPASAVRVAAAKPASSVLRAKAGEPDARTAEPGAAPRLLAPTVHAPIARDAAALWLVPSDADRVAAIGNPALAHLQAALKLYAQDKYDQALTR